MPYPIVGITNDEDFDGQDIGFKRRPASITSAVPIQIAQQDEQPALQMGAPKKAPAPITVPGSSKAQKDGSEVTPAIVPPTAKPAPITNPQFDADQAEFNRLKNSTSGIDQLRQRHPILGTIAKIGEVAGSILSPRAAAMIPGTQLHHDTLVAQAGNRVANDLGDLKSKADIDKENAETNSPKPKEEKWDVVPGVQGPNGELIEHEANSGQFRYATDLAGITRTPKEENEGKTVTVDGNVKQWNPQTKRYDIQVGAAPEKTGDDFEQYYRQYLKDNNFPDTAHNRQLARKDWAVASQAPQREPQQIVLVPTADGGQRAMVLHPGMTIPKGGMTVAEASKETGEANMSRGANAALANVPPRLIPHATAAAEKAGEDYAQDKSVSDRLSQIMDAARRGNVVSYQLIPQEGALQVTTSQGVHRINMAEIQNYGGGSLWQRLQGDIGKTLTGESIPDSVLGDMAEMQRIMATGAKTKYANKLKTINQNYGSNFQPVEMDSSSNGETNNSPGTFKRQGNVVTEQ